MKKGKKVPQCQYLVCCCILRKYCNTRSLWHRSERKLDGVCFAKHWQQCKVEGAHDKVLQYIRSENISERDDDVHGASRREMHRAWGGRYNLPEANCEWHREGVLQRHERVLPKLRLLYVAVREEWRGKFLSASKLLERVVAVQAQRSLLPTRSADIAPDPSSTQQYTAHFPGQPCCNSFSTQGVPVLFDNEKVPDICWSGTHNMQPPRQAIILRKIFVTACQRCIGYLSKAHRRDETRGMHKFLQANHISLQHCTHI